MTHFRLCNMGITTIIYNWTTHTIQKMLYQNLFWLFQTKKTTGFTNYPIWKNENVFLLKVTTFMGAYGVETLSHHPSKNLILIKLSQNQFLSKYTWNKINFCVSVKISIKLDMFSTRNNTFLAKKHQISYSKCDIMCFLYVCIVINHLQLSSNSNCSLSVEVLCLFFVH